MTEVEEEPSISWSELTECSDLNFDRDTESKSGLTATTSDDEHQTPRKGIRCKQDKPDSDLRKKLNNNRGVNNRFGHQACTPEDEKHSLTESIKYVQRKRDNDLRNKLNRDRRHGSDGSSGSNWKRDSPSERPKYTERSGGMSPLRSPINRSKPVIIFDLDNSNNFRFTNHRMGGSHKATLPNKKKQDCNDSATSPDEYEKDKSTIESDIPSSSEKHTPVHNRNLRDKDRQSWSRRRLHLQSENDDGSEDTTTENVPEPKEDDKLRLARRDKDISYGKNTKTYQLYREMVPLHKRHTGRHVHPYTPDKYKKCSRRSWDSQIKIWKLALHKWASENNCISDARDESSQKSSSEGPDSLSDPKNHKEDDFMNIFNNSLELSDKEEAIMDDEEDESFLDSMDVGLMIIEQVEDTVKSNDA